MIKKCFALLCVGFLSSLGADDLSYIDKAHQSLSEWIYNTSNKIDLFFSRCKQSNINSTDSYIDTSFDTYFEEHQRALYRYNIKARIRLPRIKKQLHLVFEDYKNGISSDTQNSSTISSSAGSNSYLIGVTFDKFKSRYLHLRVGSGVRFHGISPDAYISLLYTRKRFFTRSKWQFEISSTTRYFVNRKNEDTISFISSKVLDSYLKFTILNRYNYQQKASDKQEVVNALILDQYINSKQGISYSASLYSFGDSKEAFKPRYYLLQLLYKKYFYKNYAYYEITPGVIFRESRAFKPDFKAMIRIGLFFGKKASNGYRKF